MIRKLLIMTDAVNWELHNQPLNQRFPVVKYKGTLNWLKKLERTDETWVGGVGKIFGLYVVETKTDHFHSPLGSLLNWFNLTDGWCEKCRLQELSSEANLQYQLRWLNKIILHDTATQRSSFLGNLPHLFLGLYLTLRVQTSIRL